MPFKLHGRQLTTPIPPLRKLTLDLKRFGEVFC